MNPLIALLIFALGALATAALLWPRTGIAYRLMRRFGRSDAVLGEDALKLTLHGRITDDTSMAGELGVSRSLAARIANRLVGDGRLTRSNSQLSLTPIGRSQAVQLVRAHRLWERYLADRTGITEEEWHEEAERQEHRLTRAETELLAARMGQPLLDPHGDPIPGPEDDLPELDGEPLTAHSAGSVVEVVHLEDEPAGVYRHLRDAGLSLGKRLEVLESGDKLVRVSLDGREAELAQADAVSVTVREVEPGVAAASRTLDKLAAGATARVVRLSPALHGPQRRRLMDLGLVPGTEVSAELHAALGDPVAYRVRGALIALRREQAATVEVEA